MLLIYNAIIVTIIGQRSYKLAQGQRIDSLADQRGVRTAEFGEHEDTRTAFGTSVTVQHVKSQTPNLIY